MKKAFVWALMATLLVAGSAFAAGRNLSVAPNATFALGSPATTNNDDSCDIGRAPAATLLLPYFEVDVAASQATATQTLFTITNTSRNPQIAHIVVYTDWSFPVLDFVIFLTGYDVQSINMFDVIAGGRVPTTANTPQTGAGAISPRGARSADNVTGNPAFLASAAADCAVTQGGTIPAALLADVRSALTAGTTSTCGAARIGGTHANAIGYLVVDTFGTCAPTTPQDPAFFGRLTFDNVLIGDYQQVSPNPTTGNFAGGEAMVGIRAVPEGGAAGAGLVATNLPYTFYDRYTNILPAGQRRFDRRQPLPSTFAARYIQGGTGQFNTDFKVWREGITAGNAACGAFTNNRDLAVTELVRFDERENPSVRGGGPVFSPQAPGGVALPEASRTPTTSGTFPDMPAGTTDVGGWMYMNLNNANALGTYSTVRASQNWVIVSMAAEGRFAVDFDAAWLGNGCSPAVLAPTATTGTGTNPIGPAGNVTP